MDPAQALRRLPSICRPEKLAIPRFFPQDIVMTTAPKKVPRPVFPTLPPGWWHARRYHIFAPLLALAVTAFIAKTTPLIDLLENLTVNLRFQARSSFDPKPDPRIVFLTIDESSLTLLGRWPWPRTVQADILNTMVAANDMPHTIAYDITFTEPSQPTAAQGPGADPDAYFGKTIGDNFSSIITGAQSVSLKETQGAETLAAEKKKTDDALADLGQTAPLTNFHGDLANLYGSDMANFPVHDIRSQSLFAFVNDDPSTLDGIRHTIPLVVRVKDKVFPSLALQTACQMLSVDPDKVDVDLVDGVIRLTDISKKVWSIPVSNSGSYLINYRREENFKTLPVAGLLQNLGYYLKDQADPTKLDKDKAKIAPDCDIRNKTLFVGEDAFALSDMGPSPLHPRTPLPLVHINIINNILQNDYLRLVPFYWIVLGWSFVTWPTLLRLKDAPLGEAVLMPILAVVIYVLTCFGVFFWSIQLALAWPVIAYTVVNFGGVVLRWREEQKGRQQIKQVFAQMLSPEIVGHLMDHPENVKMGGSKRAVTIMFSDIRDYTKFSEGLDDEELVRQINTYFDKMVNCINECQGTLHKFIGDAIMCVWGDIASVAMGVERDARNAVRSALLMRLRLFELNEQRRALNLSPIRIGIGLNHGTVLVGLIGALSRSEFTVMGDAVNTASRLEGITKEFHTDLAISESVKLLIGDDFLVRRLGFIQLKGKTQATLVFEVLAEKPGWAEAKLKPEFVTLYEEGFSHFLARRFTEAEAVFVECLKVYPEDFCTQNYLKASREFAVNPPPPAWDGRIVMTTK
jgi:adenylate cyclase